MFTIVTLMCCVLKFPPRHLGKGKETRRTKVASAVPEAFRVAPAHSSCALRSLMAARELDMDSPDEWKALASAVQTGRPCQALVRALPP